MTSVALSYLMCGTHYALREGTRFALNDSSDSRCRCISGIRRSARFNEKNVGLAVSDRAVFDTLGHDKYFTRTKPDNTVSQLNIQVSKENKKAVIGIVVLVPNKFPLDLHHHQVVTVEPAHNAWLPVFREGRELIR